ncbi:chaperonin 10-like protein [Usnea florida]
MAPENSAAWLMKKQDTTHTVKEAPYNKPGPDELVIKTKAVAINPADVVLQKTGIIIDTYPAILGCDVAGVVEEVGSAIKDFQPGDRVIGLAQPRPGGIYKYAGFQQYVVLKMPAIAKIPLTLAWTDAVVLPLGINTAASCLFQPVTLALDMPTPTSHPSTNNHNNEILLIWGASSSVGSCGVQLATAAGYTVWGIASAKNHPLVHSLGAAKTFDHNDPDVVNSIVTALNTTEDGNNTVLVGAYDAISTDPSLTALRAILHRCTLANARKLIVAVAPGAERFATTDVLVKTNFQKSNEETGVGHFIWREWLESAMARGWVRCVPEKMVVGRGVGDVQRGIERLAEGVSARKVVVDF